VPESDLMEPLLEPPDAAELAGAVVRGTGAAGMA
jgi:hypothetical protein